MTLVGTSDGDKSYLFQTDAMGSQTSTQEIYQDHLATSVIGDIVDGGFNVAVVGKCPVYTFGTRLIVSAEAPRAINNKRAHCILVELDTNRGKPCSNAYHRRLSSIGLGQTNCGKDSVFQGTSGTDYQDGRHTLQTPKPNQDTPTLYAKSQA